MRTTLPSPAIDLFASSVDVAGAGARAFTLILLIAAITISVHSIRLLWEPIAEFVRMIVRVATVGLVAFMMLLLLLVLSLGYA
ncbi:hypothetical protein [Stackebrandtia soli]|uniref:hypothetical protein n=1 Tax=Stackebrandtia soli TaxID=1892856 RepID=UPI0039E8D04E